MLAILGAYDQRAFTHIDQLAADLLVRVGATLPEHIDPIASAKELGLEIAFGNLPGATARVCRNGRYARIRVSDEIVLPGRRWFSIAHEIGHYLLNHAIADERSASSWAATACDRRPPHEEREADVFAIAHNMPAAMVRRHCQLSPANLYAARAIADRFRMSPVASALRVVDLSDDACGLLYSQAGFVRWMKRSRAFPIRFAPGTRLDPATVASAFFTTGVLETDPRTLHASVWFGSRQHYGWGAIIEHAELVPEPGWGGVLSMLAPRAGSTLLAA